MNTKDAVAEVLRQPGLNKYQLAKSLGMASSTSINQWLRGTRMSASTALSFQLEYGITIDDCYDPV